MKYLGIKEEIHKTSMKNLEYSRSTIKWIFEKLENKTTSDRNDINDIIKMSVVSEVIGKF